METIGINIPIQVRLSYLELIGSPASMSRWRRIVIPIAKGILMKKVGVAYYLGMTDVSPAKLSPTFYDDVDYEAWIAHLSIHGATLMKTSHALTQAIGNLKLKLSARNIGNCFLNDMGYCPVCHMYTPWHQLECREYKPTAALARLQDEYMYETVRKAMAVNPDRFN